MGISFVPSLGRVEPENIMSCLKMAKLVHYLAIVEGNSDVYGEVIPRSLPYVFISSLFMRLQSTTWF